MNENEFKKWYCYKSGITENFFNEHFVVLPCSCDSDDCEGWAVVGNSEIEIKIHSELYK